MEHPPVRAVPNRAIRSDQYRDARCDYGYSLVALRPVGREVEQAGSLAPDWVDRAVQLERDFEHELDWFDRKTCPDSGHRSVPRTLTVEETSVRDIHRSAAVLGLAWGVSPQFILFALAGLAPAEEEWGRLVSGTWDRLSSSQRATLNGLATEEGGLRAA